jgi:hypothetical protein
LISFRKRPQVATAPAAPDQESDNAGPTDSAGDSAATIPAIDAAACPTDDNEGCKDAATASSEGEAAHNDDSGSGAATVTNRDVPVPCCGAAATDCLSCGAVGDADGCADTATTV